ncbi:hypothetical protein FB45DRAFT_1098558 [Roridomyces roridus]|uniref:Uncharacterized protein n=1 Tax=Roridomyces roridus TaxID=1738132 RepID=A0AAD7CDU5_9AGAR|nr:hypothetical protein FB45DRAFT_1098558 [Roridomyces roridus]
MSGSSYARIVHGMNFKCSSWHASNIWFYYSSWMNGQSAILPSVQLGLLMDHVIVQLSLLPTVVLAIALPTRLPQLDIYSAQCTECLISRTLTLDAVGFGNPFDVDCIFRAYAGSIRLHSYGSALVLNAIVNAISRYNLYVRHTNVHIILLVPLMLSCLGVQSRQIRVGDVAGSRMIPRCVSVEASTEGCKPPGKWMAQESRSEQRMRTVAAPPAADKEQITCYSGVNINSRRFSTTSALVGRRAGVRGRGGERGGRGGAYGEGVGGGAAAAGSVRMRRA